MDYSMDGAGPASFTHDGRGPSVQMSAEPTREDSVRHGAAFAVESNRMDMDESTTGDSKKLVGFLEQEFDPSYGDLFGVVGFGKNSAVYAIKTPVGMKAAKTMHQDHAFALQQEKKILDRAVLSSSTPIRNVVHPWDFFQRVNKSKHELFDHFKVCGGCEKCVRKETTSDDKKLPKCTLVCACHQTPENLAIFVQDFGLSLSKFVSFGRKNFYHVDWLSLAHIVSLDVLQGLEQLRQLRIVHRDCKMDNIVIGEDFCVKLIDFDWARDLQSENQDLVMPESEFGTAIYSAPEIWVHWVEMQTFSMAQFSADDFFCADLYSVGLMTLLVATAGNRHAWGMISRDILKQQMKSLEEIQQRQIALTHFITTYSGISQELREFLLCLLHNDPRMRTNYTRLAWWTTRPTSTLRDYISSLKTCTTIDTCVPAFLHAVGAAAVGSGASDGSGSHIPSSDGGIRTRSLLPSVPVYSTDPHAAFRGLISTREPVVPDSRQFAVRSKGISAQASKKSAMEPIHLDGTICTDLIVRRPPSMDACISFVLSKGFQMALDRFEVDRENGNLAITVDYSEENRWLLTTDVKKPMQCDAQRKCSDRTELLHCNFYTNVLTYRAVNPFNYSVITCLRVAFTNEKGGIRVRVIHQEGDIVESEIFSEQFEETFKVHSGVTCACCGQSPINGNMWVCAQCPKALTVCDQCHMSEVKPPIASSGSPHTDSHQWVMIQFPLDDWSTVRFPLIGAVQLPFIESGTTSSLVHQGYFCDGPACVAKRGSKRPDRMEDAVRGNRYIVGLGKDYCAQCFAASPKINLVFEVSVHVPEANSRSSYLAWDRSHSKLASNVEHETPSAR